MTRHSTQTTDMRSERDRAEVNGIIERMRGVFGRRLMVFGALLMVVAIFAACEQVPAPTSDDTPPELEWMITDHATGERREIPAEAQVEVDLESGAVVTLIARDSEGIHKIRMDGPAIGYVCARDGLGKSIGPGLIVPGDDIVLEPNDEGLVLTEIFTLDNIYFNRDCGDGWTLAGASAELHGSGENYFGGMAQSTLILNYTP